MDLSIQFQMLFQLEKRKWLIVVVFVAATHLFCQTLMLPYENALLSLVPDVKLQVQTKGSFSSKQSYINSDGEDLDNDAEFVEDESLNHIVFEEIADMDEDSPLETAKNGENAGGTGALRPTKVNPGYNDLGPKMVLKTNEYGTNGSALNGTLLGEKMKLLSSNGDQSLISQSDSSSSRNDSAAVRNPAKKKMRCEMPPRSITLIHEMNRLLIRNRARSRAMRPRWSSARDQEIQAAKLQIERAPNVKNDKELYAPLFRNISMFRSLGQSSS